VTLYESEDECEVNNKKTSLSTARHINIDQTKVAIVTPLEDKKGESKEPYLYQNLPMNS